MPPLSDIGFAALPIVLILVLMIRFRWSGSRAGAAGWLAALIIAAVKFEAGIAFLWWSQVSGFFQALYVIYIIWGALVFFRVTETDGTLKAMSALLKQVAPERTLQVLILAWAFSSFLQGVGGFGVPIAVVAPILVQMQFSPLEAVLMPSLGHAWAISFGSLGSSFYALTGATGMHGADIAIPMAIFLSILCFQAGFIILWIAGGKTALRKGWLSTLIMAVTMTVTQGIAAYLELWTIAAMLGALAGLIVGSIWAIARREKPDTSPHSETIALMDMLPYLLLLLIIFAEKFIPIIHNLLNHVNISIPIPEIATGRGVVVPAGATRGIALFGHPGTLLIYTGVLSLLIALKRNTLPPGGLKKIAQGVKKSGVKSTWGILTLVCMAVTMRNAGMIAVLSEAMAKITGVFFPAISPFIGALGAFMTGSNTSSNIIFGAFQKDVASSLGYSIPLMLAIHNAGAAIGSVFAPAKVIVGCSTVGLSGGEGESEAFRRILRYGLWMIASLSLIGWIALQ